MLEIVLILSKVLCREANVITKGEQVTTEFLSRIDGISATFLSGVTLILDNAMIELADTATPNNDKVSSGLIDNPFWGQASTGHADTADAFNDRHF